ncbi:MAG: MFS transporter [Patescibacteria group bacterium]
MKKNRIIIYSIGFLFSIPIALTSYINSSFLREYINNYYISIIYVIASIITIWALSRAPELLSKIGNRKSSLWFSFATFLSLILLAVGGSKIIVIPAFIAYFIFSNIFIASLDIFIEEFSGKKSIGKFRGLYLMIINSAWVIAQTISGSIINKSSFKGIYLFAAIFMLLVSIMLIIFLRKFKDPIYKKMSMLKALKTFWKRKALRKIYLINLILKFFYAWMIIYTPIYLYQYLNFGWNQIGLIFTIMLLPFVILEFPLGKISDKIGEKKLLITGFIIITFFTLIIPFITEPKVWIWGLILFGTRVGAAIIEVMSETYFFKKVEAENAEEINFFRNTYPLAYIIAPIFAIPILFLVPSFEYLFYVLGVILLIGLFITLKLRDVK